jgi:outer membrane protein assembly factor BamA
LFGLFLVFFSLCGDSSTSDSGGIAQVRVEGLRHTDSARVFAEIQAVAGMSCDSLCAQADLDRLERLGVFASVTRIRKDDTLVYQVVELPWFLPVPNGRISDEEGLSLGAGVKTPNLLGQAIAGEFLFLAGRDFEWQAAASSNRVGQLPVAWDMVTSRTQRWDDGRRYREISYSSSLRTQAPSDGPLRVLGEANLVEVHANRPGIALSADRSDWIPSLRAGLVWDDRDRLGLTTSGAYQEITLEKAGRPMGGPVDAWELLSDTRLWIPLSARWGLHASNLLERQWGTVGGWRTYVVGGANTARGLPSAWSVAPSEELSTLELRWLALPVRTETVWGQSFFWGLQAVAGTDFAVTWQGGGDRERRGEGFFAGADVVFPFVERLRLVAAWSRSGGAGFGVSAGLFEKTQAQRYRIR